MSRRARRRVRGLVDPREDLMRQRDCSLLLPGQQRRFGRSPQDLEPLERQLAGQEPRDPGLRRAGERARLASDVGVGRRNSRDSKPITRLSAQLARLTARFGPQGKRGARTTLKPRRPHSFVPRKPTQRPARSLAAASDATVAGAPAETLPKGGGTVFGWSQRGLTSLLQGAKRGGEEDERVFDGRDA